MNLRAQCEQLTRNNHLLSRRGADELQEADRERQEQQAEVCECGWWVDALMRACVCGFLGSLSLSLALCTSADTLLCVCRCRLQFYRVREGLSRLTYLGWGFSQWTSFTQQVKLDDILGSVGDARQW